MTLFNNPLALDSRTRSPSVRVERTLRGGLLPFSPTVKTTDVRQRSENNTDETGEFRKEISKYSSMGSHVPKWLSAIGLTFLVQAHKQAVQNI